MPRLPPSLLRHAYSLSHHLPSLLKACRDLSSALNELRWLSEHVSATTTNAGSHHDLLRKLVAARATGKPLQYILGTQPFGALEILCRKGVLIPRPETESQTIHLAHLLSHPTSHLTPHPLRILDLCTGTGAIPLHLSSLLPPPHTTGVDFSPPAIALARKNLTHNIALRHLPPSASNPITFVQDDIFHPTNPAQWLHEPYDVLVSNPPYISPRGYETETARSVRGWEPRSALVPPPPPPPPPPPTTLTQAVERGDEFYPRLLKIADAVDAKVLLFEVGGMAQAGRVAGMVGAGGWDGCEVWRDWPDLGHGGVEIVDGVRVRGEGNGRGVFAWRGIGGKMIGRGEG